MVASMVEETANGSGYRWLGDRVERLKQLWPDHSATQIAKLFGNLTRNAIIGKANRLKLKRKKPSGNGQKKPQRVVSGPRLRPPVFCVSFPPPVLRLDFLNLTLEEIRGDECH